MSKPFFPQVRVSCTGGVLNLRRHWLRVGNMSRSFAPTVLFVLLNVGGGLWVPRTLPVSAFQDDVAPHHPCIGRPCDQVASVVAVPPANNLGFKREPSVGSPGHFSFLQAVGGVGGPPYAGDGSPLLASRLDWQFLQQWHTDGDKNARDGFVAALPRVTRQSQILEDCNMEMVSLLDRVLSRNPRITLSAVEPRTHRRRTLKLKIRSVAGTGGYNIVVKAFVIKSWFFRLGHWLRSRGRQRNTARAPGGETGQQTGTSGRRSSRSRGQSGREEGRREPQMVSLRIRMGGASDCQVTNEMQAAEVVQKCVSETDRIMLVFPEDVTPQVLVSRFRFAVPLFSGRIRHRSALLGQSRGYALLNYMDVLPPMLCDLFAAQSVVQPSMTRAIAKQLLELVAHLQALGVVHSDLKPENVLVDEAGNLFLADFDKAHKVGSRVRCGSLPHSLFADPQTVICRETTPDQEVTLAFSQDAWALGMLMYDIFCHNWPFMGMDYNNDSDTSNTIILAGLLDRAAAVDTRAPIDWIGCDNPRVESEIKDLISRLLDVDPENRLDVLSFYMHSDFFNEGRNEANRSPPQRGAAILPLRESIV
ncbi:rhoptry kinase family protein ROP39 [Toxoplasma gondii MAS]|uniref:Rhoptry kinase family protein ROP39 n=1 Tax=Toxoplasma gondii MAS TaxID=943118 RepID=A0A086QS09_TOXGO|nr:rhoptry kinase family protein ROP39 [Toxoplasma gondii MAS]